MSFAQNLIHINKYTLELHHAVKSESECCEFIKGHQQVLEKYGLGQLSSSAPRWIEDPLCWIVIARNRDGEIIGGVRVHKYSSAKQNLPLIKAVPNEEDIINLLTKTNGSVGEICGLWNSHSVSGQGLSFLLVRTGVSLVHRLGIESLFTIASEFTMGIVKSLGFEIVSAIGEEGSFDYPTPEYKTTILCFTEKNAPDLEKREHNRKLMMGEKIEIGPKGYLLIDYSLK